MTGVALTRRSFGVSLDPKLDSDPRTTESPSMTSWEKTVSILSSLIEIPPPEYHGSRSSYDPALDTYLHSGMWMGPTLKELRDYTFSATMSRCRSFESIFPSTGGSRSARTSRRKTLQKSRARRTTTTSTAWDTSSSLWMSFLILRWKAGLAPLLIWRPCGYKITSTESLKRQSNGQSPEVIVPAGYRPT